MGTKVEIIIAIRNGLHVKTDNNSLRTPTLPVRFA
jgi:hypothetical protein